MIAIDTRARWIERLANMFATNLTAWRTTDRALECVADALGVTIRKLRRCLDASPDLRAAFVAKGWRP